MLVECGFTRATLSDGTEYTFTPSFGRIASLGDPHSIVRTYLALFGPSAHKEAPLVLAGLCDQEDATPLVGWLDDDGWHAGLMPADEQVIVARHLMFHGIIGKDAMSSGGDPVDHFNASEYVSAARVHLGLSSADAEALSMTEFQAMLAMKFPDLAESKASAHPTKEEYDAAMVHLMAVKERCNVH
jgi:Family of unknown function (DUF6246)